MKNILSYIDNYLEQKLIKTGDYPKKLLLTKQMIKQMKKELKNHIPIINYGWINKKLLNYRGILIKVKKEK